MISPDGTSRDPAKVTAVQGWNTPKCVNDVQAFMAFANFYQHFIRRFSRVTSPLIMLTRKDTPFGWTPEAQKAFDTLMKAFTTAPIVMHFDPEKAIIVQTDASDYVSAAIMSQLDDNQVLRPVAFVSKKCSPAECNYKICDKKLPAIIRAFEEWH